MYQFGVDYNSGGYVVGTTTGVVASFALTSGVGAGTSAGMTVSRWQVPAANSLRSGDWVMKGGTSTKNWFLSGKFNPLRPNRHIPFANGRNFIVPRSTLRYPKGSEWFKGLPPWNQRQIR